MINEQEVEDNWNKWVAETNALDTASRRTRIYFLSSMWMDDWDFFRTILECQNTKSIDIQDRKQEYFAGCRKRLKECFGYAGVFEPSQCRMVTKVFD